MIPRLIITHVSDPLVPKYTIQREKRQRYLLRRLDGNWKDAKLGRFKCVAKSDLRNRILYVDISDFDQVNYNQTF